MFFCNSGAEANEAAIKLVRKARPRGDVIVAHHAFHGRTYGALSATPQEAKQAPFAPLVPGFRAMPAVEIPDAIDANTAAVLIEPVQGESGVNLIDRRAAGLDPRRLRRGRRGAGLRRGPDRHGADRLAVGLRAARRRARTR